MPDSAESNPDAFSTSLTFESLGVAEPLCKALADQGITTAFPIQALTIADALAGRDVCGKAKTGSGKTLAFGLPMLQRLAASSPTPRERRAATGPPARPRGLVLLPTRELAVQVYDVLRPLGEHLGLRVAAVYGGADIERQIRQLRKGCEVIIATPGRRSTSATAASSRWRHSTSWSSTRPTAWPTWASCPRSSGSCAALPAAPPDAVVLGDARRRGRPGS